VRRRDTGLYQPLKDAQRNSEETEAKPQQSAVPSSELAQEPEFLTHEDKAEAELAAKDAELRKAFEAGRINAVELSHEKAKHENQLLIRLRREEEAARTNQHSGTDAREADGSLPRLESSAEKETKDKEHTLTSGNEVSEARLARLNSNSERPPKEISGHIERPPREGPERSDGPERGE
jgi:hypothetical protein